MTQSLSDDERIDWFTIESDNIESIHNHNAYAFVERNLKAERAEKEIKGRVHQIQKQSL